MSLWINKSVWKDIRLMVLIISEVSCKIHYVVFLVSETFASLQFSFTMHANHGHRVTTKLIYIGQPNNFKIFLVEEIKIQNSIRDKRI